MASHQTAATLGVALQLEMGNFVTEANKAAQETQKLKNTIASQMRAADKEIQALKYATEDYGKAVTKVAEIERQLETGRLKSIKGTEKAAELLAQAAAYDKIAASQKKSLGTLTDQQKLQVSYQLTDFFTQIASGQNAMIAFMQQGGQLKDSMGGIGNAFRAVLSFITPVNTAIAVTATVIGSVGLAFYKAADELDRFKDAMSLTGRYAGIAYDQYLKLGNVLSEKVGTSIGNARDVMEALVSSGKFTGSTLESVGSAILNFARAAGVDAKEAAKQLIPSLDGTASSAKSLNEKYHFLTIAQYRRIEALEREGNLQEAVKITADALAESLEKTKRNLGNLEQAWKNIKEWASSAWDAMLGWGREPGGDRAKELETKINQMEAWLEKRRGQLPAADLKAKEQQLQSMKNELNTIVNRIGTEMDVASAAAKKAEEEQKKINLWSKAGGAEGALSARKAAEKAEIDAMYHSKEALASEQEKIELELQRKIQQAKMEEAEKNEKTFGQFQSYWARERVAKVADAEAEATRKRKELKWKKDVELFDKETDIIFRLEKEREKIFADIATKRDEQKYTQESLDAKFSLIGATQKEIDVTMARIEAQKDLDKLMRSQEFKNMSANEQKLAKQQMDDVLKAKIANIELAESLRYVQNMYDAVWSNMSSAIENFVRTGKLSIKDFTRSVIQDMLIMNMKLQAMTLVRGLINSVFGRFTIGGVQGPDNIDVGGGWNPARADGGGVDAGKIGLVGERGPELFIPKTAGTIIPHEALSSMGGTTNVTNNYINAIDTKSFEQRLLESNQAIWSANQYANKSLASNGRRA